MVKILGATRTPGAVRLDVFGKSIVSLKYGPTPPPNIEVSSLGGYSSARQSYYDGEKFYGGFGETQLFTMDYWTLRARSNQIFTENLYARGIVHRLVTNEINTGLAPDSNPEGVKRSATQGLAVLNSYLGMYSIGNRPIMVAISEKGDVCTWYWPAW